MFPHLAITAVVGGVCRRGTRPIEKDVSSEALESGFTFPGGVGEVVPMCFIKYGKLAPAATDELVTRDAVHKQRFHLGLDVVRSGVIGR